MVSKFVFVFLVAVAQISTAQTCPCASPATITTISGPTTIITPSVSTITVPNLFTSCSSSISDLSVAQSLADTVQLYLGNECKIPCAKKNYGCGCNKELILPPLAAELPCGVGFLEAALPLVASSYGCGCLSYPSYDCGVPETSPCGCGLLPKSSSCGCGLTLPAPLFAPCGCGCVADSPASCCCPNYSSLVRPVIL